ncbi:MAG TPA: hypothetical protein VJ850_07760 [Candidatus Limnocylindrales bacterium]|nr:hypothetical protein [Candidatus Limnocylindrales bacterium]
MKDDRVEELLRTLPPDEPTYVAAPLPAVVTVPIARATPTTKRTLTAATSLAVVAVIVIIGGALFGATIGRYMGSPTPSGQPARFETTLPNPEWSHPVSVVLEDRTGLALGFAPELPAVAPGGPDGGQIDATPRIYAGNDPTTFAVVWMGGACVDRIELELTGSSAKLDLSIRFIVPTNAGCRLVGITRTVWIRLSQPVDPSTIAINGREVPVLAPSASPTSIAEQEISDAFWAKVIQYDAEPTRFHYDTLEDIVADSDLIVRGRITGQTMVGCAAQPSPALGEPDVCDLAQQKFLLVTIDETLKSDGPQASDTVMVKLAFSGIPDSDLPGGELILFLKNFGKLYTDSGAPTPSDSPRWQWYALPNTYQGALRKIDDVVLVPEAPAGWWEANGPFPINLDTQPFGDVVDRIAGIVAASEVPTPGPGASGSPVDASCSGGGKVDSTGTQWYEGVCYGWRVGHEDISAGDVHDRNLQLGCNAKLYGDSVETSGPPWGDQRSDLDIEVSDVPDGMTLDHIDKWTCGTRGLSDHAILTVAGTNTYVDIARYLDGSGWLVVDALPGTVRSCQVRGLPAVCVDRVPTSEYAMSIASVFVLEDPTIHPYGVVLRLYSEELPLADLLRVAEQVVRT